MYIALYHNSAMKLFRSVHMDVSIVYVVGIVTISLGTCNQELQCKIRLMLYSSMYLGLYHNCIMNLFRSLHMDVSIVYVTIVGIATISLGTCNQELQCKIRVGCELNGCNPLSSMFYDGKYKDDFPMLCQAPSDGVQAQMAEDHNNFKEYQKTTDEEIKGIKDGDVFFLFSA